MEWPGENNGGRLSGADTIVLHAGDWSSSLAVADTILDFTDERDAPNLEGGLQYSDLTIA